MVDPSVRSSLSEAVVLCICADSGSRDAI
jgi:hypothetical protein